MDHRNQGDNQELAAAKAGISERSARRIDAGELTTSSKPRRHWRTRNDPLTGVWDEVLVPMLENNPELLPMTLLEFLNEQYPDQFDNRIQRTLQRRVKSWKAQYGPDKEVIFRQKKIPGLLGLSDFTQLKNSHIIIAGEVFKHRLYHYRLAFSGWCYVKAICGGESFTALSTGLQNAFHRCGGAPLEHRTDSLSAAFNNLAEKQLLTERYEALCQHYNVKATRNNPGQSHENGAIESPHGHLKRRIEQALILRGSNEFASLDDYQGFIDGIVSKINRQNKTRIDQERPHLQSLPKRRTQDYAEHSVMISRSSTFSLKRVTYSVPSRLIGERLYVQLYDDHLDLYLGHEHVLELKRVYASKSQRGHCINYRHLIDSLVKKPQAFRYSQIREHLLPNIDYEIIWDYVDEHLPAHQACRYIVRLLHLAANADCERALGQYVLGHIDQGHLPTELQCSRHFTGHTTVVPFITQQQHTLDDYDALLSCQEAIHHG